MDRKTLKILAADRRVDILKLLTDRRMTGAELAKRLALSPSTVFEHLQKLEQAQLVRRIDTGHKWVYYQLTEEAENIIQPRQPIAIMLSIAAGAILTGFSALSLFTRNTISNMSDLSDTFQTATEKAVQAAETASQLAPPTTMIQDTLLGILLAGGIFLLLAGIGFFMKKRAPTLSSPPAAPAGQSAGYPQSLPGSAGIHSLPEGGV